ncbi:MAG: DUF1800 domain-containing protein, partial [Chloroflexi bacterium]|nr:DUF1800 domain-containing protein [Chloroflexota bacterium]
QTGGDIKSMLRTVFLSAEFAQAPPKLKRPITLMASALRALRADIRNRGIREIAQRLRWMGHIPFMWPMPDGYPDVANDWLNNLLPRWNFAFDLISGGFEQIDIDFDQLTEAAQVADVPGALRFFSRLTLGHALNTELLAQLEQHVGATDLSQDGVRQRVGEAIAALLASPEFQWM